MWVGNVQLVLRTIRTHTYTQREARFVAVARRPRSAADAVPWLPQRTSKSLRCDNRYTAAADSTATRKMRNNKNAPLFSVRETVVFLNPTATCCRRSPAIHSREKKKHSGLLEGAFGSMFGGGVYPSLSTAPPPKEHVERGTKKWRNIDIECRRAHKVARLSVEQRANMIHEERDTGPL